MYSSTDCSALQLWHFLTLLIPLLVVGVNLVGAITSWFRRNESIHFVLISFRITVEFMCGGVEHSTGHHYTWIHSTFLFDMDTTPRISIQFCLHGDNDLLYFRMLPCCLFVSLTLPLIRHSPVISWAFNIISIKIFVVHFSIRKISCKYGKNEKWLKNGE